MSFGSEIVLPSERQPQKALVYPHHLRLLGPSLVVRRDGRAARVHVNAILKLTKSEPLGSGPAPAGRRDYFVCSKS